MTHYTIQNRNGQLTTADSLRDAFREAEILSRTEGRIKVYELDSIKRGAIGPCVITAYQGRAIETPNA